MPKRNILDDFSQVGALGSTNAVNNFFGMDHRGTGDLINTNKDLQGLTFFTRPRLNLSYDNIALARILTPMLTDDPMTMSRVIRTILDPIGQKERNITTPLVDANNPFIAILTNNLTSMSGWPDVNLDTYTSPEGIHKESWSMVDTISLNFSTYDITANFRNLQGNPILTLFYYWTQYQAMVFEGTLTPYPDMIIENVIDYMTRIYRLVLDPSKRYVQAIGNCGAAFPTAVSVGAGLNFTKESPFANENEQISIPFRCMGFEYNDPIVIQEFNEVVCMYNRGMGDAYRSSTHIKLDSYEELKLFNFNGYPRIAPDNELEWWVPIDKYNNLVQDFNQNVLVSNSSVSTVDVTTANV